MLFIPRGAGPSPIVLSDNFDRANSTTSAGPNWTNRNGHMGISSNQAYPVDTGLTYNVASHATTMSTDNHRVEANWYGFSAQEFQCVLFMGAGTTPSVQLAVLELWFNISQFNMAISTRTSWALANEIDRAGPIAVNFTDGDLFSLERSGTLFTARQNGVSQLTWDDGGPWLPKDSNHRMVGIAGFVNSDNTGNRIDNFKAYDL